MKTEFSEKIMNTRTHANTYFMTKNVHHYVKYSRVCCEKGFYIVEKDGKALSMALKDVLKN